MPANWRCHLRCQGGLTDLHEQLDEATCSPKAVPLSMLDSIFTEKIDTNFELKHIESLPKGDEDGFVVRCDANDSSTLPGEERGATIDDY